MALSAKASDYDYTIHDANGVAGVKDGKQYPISKEDWERENPHREHRDSVCTECNFVRDKETLLTFLVPREQKEQATSKPLFVGNFTMPGWTGHSGFYLFKCSNCGKVCIDYPHGYRHKGCLYVQCGHCQLEIVFNPKRYKDVYKRERVVSPPTSKLWVNISNIGLVLLALSMIMIFFFIWPNWHLF